ncbi:hypothetical protein L5515_003378 [Caenorhabditis briggsae]|uniref:Uncharacterized protein n=1 Tax=Caenorhabditis briggsae TaxID=6238 RepID=A0AAE9EJ22_CAEBR|nr:hypothetical protein L5515_003378 [Caenorhabditis briggsae]
MVMEAMMWNDAKAMMWNDGATWRMPNMISFVCHRSPDPWQGVKMRWKTNQFQSLPTSIKKRKTRQTIQCAEARRAHGRRYSTCSASICLYQHNLW